MNTNLESRLEHAHFAFKNRGHKDIQSWTVEDGMYRMICMNCGASIVVNPNDSLPPSIVGESRIRDNGTVKYCLKIHEYDRLKRMGK